VSPLHFDPRKSRRNAAERGLPFEALERFDWLTCLIGVSKTQDPTTTRFTALGMLDGDLVFAVFTLSRAGIRVISLRRASRKERKRYVEG
jgi:uncharacterized DUF497 family protein